MDATMEPEKRKVGTLLGIGGVLGAIAASTCCILPLVLFFLGVSGAWVGNLTALEPYQPIFIAVTLGLLATGFYLVYRRPKPVAASVVSEGAVCQPRVSRRGLKIALWASTVLVVIAAAFPYLAPVVLGT